MDSAGAEIFVGSKVELDKKRAGVVRYVGEVHWASGKWYGIELLQAVGKCDGKRDDKRYFYCGTDRGVFVQRDKIRRVVTHRKSASTARIFDMVDPMTKLNKSVERWDNVVVCRWLNNLKLSAYIENFDKIDGPALLKLKPFDLMTKHGVNDEDDRIMMIQEIRKLQEREPMLKISEKRELDDDELKVDGAVDRRKGRSLKGKRSSRSSRQSASNFVIEADITEWSVDDVVRYINGLGGKASQYGEQFREEQINGQRLAMITDDDLKEMGVEALGVRKKILNGLQDLVEKM